MNTTMAEYTTPQCLVKALESHEKRREYLLSLADDCRVAEQAKAEFSIVNGVDIVSYTDVIHLNCVVGSIHEVAPLLRWLGEKGYRQSQDPYDYIGVRFYYLGRIEVRVGFEGGTCRVVKVGEKAEPVYELRCGGAE